MTDMIFKFGEQELLFVGTAERPEWRAKDVIDILYPESDPRNRGNYIEKVPPKWVHHKRIMTSAGERDFLTLLEPGLYYLAARSNSPLAIPFQEWLFEEVIPAIRKTGGYQLNSRMAHENERLKRKRKELNAPLPAGSMTLGTVAKMYDLDVDTLLQLLGEEAETGMIKTFCKISRRQRILKEHLKKIRDLVQEHRELCADTWQLGLLDELDELDEFKPNLDLFDGEV